MSLGQNLFLAAFTVSIVGAGSTPDPGLQNVDVVPAAPAQLAFVETATTLNDPTTTTVTSINAADPVASTTVERQAAAFGDTTTSTTTSNAVATTAAPLYPYATTTTSPIRNATSTTASPSTTAKPLKNNTTTTSRSTTTIRPTTTTSAAPTTTTTSPAAGAQWRLVWADEFNANSVDSSKWAIENSTYGDGNNELQCYHPDNVSVSNGALHLTALPQVLTCPNGSTRQYSSGMVRTLGLASWTYGRFEFRAKIPEGKGLWPALWMSPTEHYYGGWPRSGELDVMEAIGQKPERIIGSAHWGADSGHQLSNREYWLPSGKFSDDYHVFTMDWSPNSIIWYIDGIEYHRITQWAAPTGFVNPAPFDRPFYVKMNLAVGGRSPGDPDATTPWPATFSIDWVHIYQK